MRKIIYKIYKITKLFFVHLDFGVLLKPKALRDFPLRSLAAF